MSDTAAAPRQLLPRDERRAQILRTAAAAFSREGYAATSVEDVAQEAGITKLIVYRHFESKSELYAAILEQVTDRLVGEWRAVTDDEHAAGAAVPTLLTVGRELPDGFRLLQLRLADHLLRELLPEGPFREWVVTMTIDYLVSAVLEWLDVGDPADDEWWVERASDGLRAAIVEWVSSSTPPSLSN